MRVDLSQVFVDAGLPTNQRPDRNMITAHIKYNVLHTQYMGLATKAFGRIFGNYTLMDTKLRE